MIGSSEVIVFLLFKEGPDRLPLEAGATYSIGKNDYVNVQPLEVSLHFKPAGSAVGIQTKRKRKKVTY